MNRREALRPPCCFPAKFNGLRFEIEEIKTAIDINIVIFQF